MLLSALQSSVGVVEEDADVDTPRRAPIEVGYYEGALLGHGAIELLEATPPRHGAHHRQWDCLVLAKLLGGVDLHGEMKRVMWRANAEQPQQVERRFVPAEVDERDDALVADAKEHQQLLTTVQFHRGHRLIIEADGGDGVVALAHDIVVVVDVVVE